MTTIDKVQAEAVHLPVRSLGSSERDTHTRYFLEAGGLIVTTELALMTTLVEPSVMVTLTWSTGSKPTF